MSAPYTRETLDRIRRGASARELGWDDERYRRVCRQHGIEPVASSVALPMPPAPVTRAHVAPVEAAPSPPVDASAPATTFDPRTGSVTRNRRTVEIGTSSVAAAILEALARHPGVRLSRTALVERVRCASHTVPSAIFRLRIKLRPCGLTIDGHKGHGGGYHVVDVASGKPATITIARSSP